ncbi:MAG: carbon-nitrogen hydrolase family protein, partial [Chloroflexi bacterium]|nr:carbon-nitrogen hydrolase family protein [Chloroflexota bacterium]
IQMDANPAPTEERIARAQILVEGAAEAGADLVVLPELFNTGYQYAPANHELAEPMNGRTATWLRDTAARLNIHLTGSLMLLDANEVFNALLLFAPDGRFWRYDKNYPWGWERGYFRDASRITIAETDLGDFGMLICWDSAHRDLWRQYAGQVDMMLIASCPPDVSNPTYLFPDGERVTVDELGPMMGKLKGDGRRVFGDMINQQTGWLGVPAVNTVGCGQITTDIPAGTATLLSFMPLAPRIAQYLPQAEGMQMQCDMVQGCKIVAADGSVTAELSQDAGETFVIAEVTLADEKPQPQTPQPPAAASPISYLASDYILPLITTPVYRQGLRQTWGRHMAPINATSRRWLIYLGITSLITFIIGSLRRQNCK